MRCKRLSRGSFFAVLLTLAGITAAQAANVTLRVVEAHGGPDIANYQYIINVDNTGHRMVIANTGLPVKESPTGDCNPATPGYPANCSWPSIAGMASSSPIVTQGTQDDFAGGIELPNGRYLISVLAGGYKLDGRHFTVDSTKTPIVSWQGKGAGDPGSEVKVEMQATPLPDSQIQAAVFEDASPTNASPDPGDRGLAGFRGTINDVLGEVTTDVYGAPLCGGGQCLSKCYVVDGGVDVGTVAPTDAAGRCPLDTTGLTTTLEGDPIPAGAAVQGKLKIPNLGPNRYSLSITPPNGSGWIQTTTLEGSHDFDAWQIEGATGLDTEFILGAEPFPSIIFGYVPQKGTPSDPGLANNLGGTGHISGRVEAVRTYVPGIGGVGPLPGTGLGCCVGIKLDKPIEEPWISLADLDNGDTTIWVGRGNADGTFDIPNVPAGNYQLVWWDEPQNYALDFVNVIVGQGESVDLGLLPMTGWWAVFDGYVFNDDNRNGVKDPGESGIPGYGLTLRVRNNTLMDRGSNAVTTDAFGYYQFEMAYPTGNFIVMEAYDDLHYNTGVTYYADNQVNGVGDPTPTTDLGGGVDVSVLSLIGHYGRVDWGKHVYDATGTNGVDPQNGGIVGSISYDTTRNELDPRYAAVEDWQPGISNLTVNLWAPVDCGTNPGTPCATAENGFEFELAGDGSYAKGPLLNTYTSETWQQPSGCVARDGDGVPLVHGTDEQVLPLDPNADCIEGPLVGIQVETYAADGNFGANVDGNFGFGDGCFISTDPFVPGAMDPESGECTSGTLMALPSWDYLVEVAIPTEADVYGPDAVHPGRPLYKVTREEDINIGNGDEFYPAVPPPACVGPLHTVDSSGNETFPGGPGTSPYEGLSKHLCTMKLVTLNNGSSIAPLFNLYTDVPVPTRFYGLFVDDLNFTSNKKSVLYGEKAGIQFTPIGIYDFTNRLVTTVESDYNGIFDVLLPSSNRISCPTPSGVCGNVYRFVGNDPGVPGRLNLNHNPQFRTISADFEALPGQFIPADLAPTQVGVATEGIFGNVTTIQPVACLVNDPTAPDPASITPELYAVSTPYVRGIGSFTIRGFGFGPASGGQVTLDGVALPTTGWSGSQIDVNVPVGTAFGPHQLKVTAANGRSTVNGLTFHVLSDDAAVAFPSTSVLDNFNRANNNSLGGGWTGLTLGYRIDTNTLQVRAGTALSLPRRSTSYGANQEAYFTFTDVSTLASTQGLVLKATSGGLAGIYVLYNRAASTIEVWTLNGLNLVQQGTLTGASFANGDQLGARALANGFVYAYKNGTLIGSVNVTGGANPWPAALAQGGGQIGVRFQGTTNTAAGDARVDNFGGGTMPAIVGAYDPVVVEVGPGRTYQPAETLPAVADHAIQRALDAAPVGALVVVYPNTPSADPRQNPRGAYYENLILSKPVKLQGVGPGSPDGSVVGSILDGGAFAGDSPVFTDWYTRIGAPFAWDGNQTVYDGAVISLFLRSSGATAFPTSFSANTAPSIDGFDIRGGDQQGFPGNIDNVTGLPTNQPGGLVTQGGAIFANAYARNLQITNNAVQNNGGAYGTIRLGTPDLPGAASSNHNEGVRIMYNRVIANAGTNLAGGIGLFNGSDRYQIVRNDICGNFSAEYGGGISAYGRSPNGKISDNRIYFNRSYDEGGGIMIAGELPLDPAALSVGSGPVDIYNNVIQGNLGNDDGGGIRFLMAGGFGGVDVMNVYNNFIVNNVTTHEGGGIALNDSPNVRIFNNTIMKNLSTDTAVTALANTPAPAGLSSTSNSAQLQETLPASAPTFSNPLLFNNIFWDNRAGTRSGGVVTGLGNPGDVAPIDQWDLGVTDGSGLLAPTNSIVQQSAATHPYTTSATNSGANPSVVSAFDIPVSFDVWRNNPAFIGAILVAADLPPNLLGNYHLAAGSPAINLGAASKSGVAAPAFDIDVQGRPAGGGFDGGADEFGAAPYTPPAPTGGTAEFSTASVGALAGGTLDFGSLSGATNRSTITLSVTGSSVQFGAVTVQAGNGARFTEVSGAAGGTCQGHTFNAGSTCTVVVNFNANGDVQRTGGVTVKRKGGAAPITLVLTGK